MELKIKYKNDLKVFFIDDEDYDLIKEFKLYFHDYKNKNKQYIKCCTSDGLIPMHRIIMNVCDNKIFVDHINHNGLDNRKSNLRLCTRSQNGANRRKKINSSSKYLGVCWDKTKKTWEVKITHKNKSIRIGRFKNEIDAAKSYNEAASKYHGEFSNLNII